MHFQLLCLAPLSSLLSSAVLGTAWHDSVPPCPSDFCSWTPSPLEIPSISAAFRIPAPAFILSIVLLIGLALPRQSVDNSTPERGCATDPAAPIPPSSLPPPAGVVAAFQPVLTAGYRGSAQGRLETG
uniref:Uncharacterized protein n=1 Tax=Tetraselmis sp. GSL018 TaxID=582737 RepID=A0A061RSP4_9CHLO